MTNNVHKMCVYSIFIFALYHHLLDTEQLKRKGSSFTLKIDDCVNVNMQK